jgi:hypothetical protein
MPGLLLQSEEKWKGCIVKLWELLFLTFAFLLALLCSACTRFAPQRTAVGIKVEERVREHVAAARLANQEARKATSSTRKLMAYDLSEQFLGRAQALVGLPLEDQTDRVTSLIEENEQLRRTAVEAEAERAKQEQVWRTEKATYEARLLEYGAKYEEQRNKSIVRRLWGWLVSTLGIGGIIALCVFCPAAIPILLRIVAWVVNQVPALASAAGVVSRKAFDQVVIGVQNAKAHYEQKGNSEAAQVLSSNLAQAMAGHPAHDLLVRSRKASPAVKAALA